jgi:NTE family protein
MDMMAAFSPDDLNPAGFNTTATNPCWIYRLRAVGAPDQAVHDRYEYSHWPGQEFRSREITPDAPLASACLPTLFHAVEIEAENYWTAAIRPTRRECSSDDTILVQINPIERRPVPKIAREISPSPQRGFLQYRPAARRLFPNRNAPRGWIIFAFPDTFAGS